ncbi:DNA polymerase II large subunit [Candidatus Pacearchaeota archaeon]|nr:DNA polymerase II large subunit [Candidatus Pacearchaeota archaeon]
MVTKENYAWDTEEYFKDLIKRVKEEYSVANMARAKGIDPVDKVEIPLAMTMAEKSVGLITTIYPDIPIQKISKRMLELEAEYGQLDTTVSFVIAREIAEEKFCKFKDQLEAIDVGIRVGFAYITLGVVASPIEGYTGISLGKTRDGKDYFIASFSGPIRSAGTTATCVVLMLIDYLREHFGYAKYDPDENEIKRYITENTDYHERVTNLQYFPTEEEMEFLARNLPIQISGDPTEKFEVSNYKDLPRVASNFIRGGMCLTFSEGLAQKAGKALGRLSSPKKEGLICTGWDWLGEYLELHKKREKGGDDIVATYIKDLVAGRPVYGHPSRPGGFRFRYGRSRVSGFSAVSIHPATMGITNGFLSHGTQLKIEKPTKGCIITSCDQIDGPIVKLFDGSVKRIIDFEESKKIYKDVEEIIYLGDLLFPLGDVIDRNAMLLKPGYVEEWWELELQEKMKNSGSCFEDDAFKISLEDAINFSEKYSLPLSPKYIFYWSQISKDDFVCLMDWLQNIINVGVLTETSHAFLAPLGKWTGKLVLPWESSVREKFKEGKRALEILGVEHQVVLDNVVIDGDAKAFLVNLGLPFMNVDDKLKEGVGKIIDGCKDFENTLDIVNDLSKFEIKDKAGTFIGTRMGRPEKAKLRRLTGSPNGLFPISEQGGRFRSVQAAVEVGYIKSDWPIFKCECGNETIYSVCEKCGEKTKRMYYCRDCKALKLKPCKGHEEKCFKFSNRKIDSKNYFNSARDLLGYENWEIPPLIKGVRGTSSDAHDFEHLAKGILRAKFNLCVNKDGTIRYDGTEISLTHFKPIEIKSSVDKLKELGYENDIYGELLERDDQILELKPHDVVLSSCSISPDERADDVFFNIANFVDEELEKLYDVPRYYNLKSKEDLIGQLVACMAPHNCAGVIGRIIGFSELQGLVASPYMHAAMRRDCDGDEAAVMLLMDVLINFSRKFLPSHRGGTQDAPLVLNAHIRAGEVDDQILSFEVCDHYPLEIYRLAEQGKHSKECKIETVQDRLSHGVNPFTNTGFTHDSTDFNTGVLNGAYKILPTMKEKVNGQMELVGKIRAVDTEDVARLIIERHFIRDIRGNLRKFARQQFRCVKCNAKFRRPPLSGVCTKCGGKIIFTISEGSIKKYLDPAMDLANNYNISQYTKEGMDLTEMYIESIFGKESEKQIDLKKWF